MIRHGTIFLVIAVMLLGEGLLPAQDSERLPTPSPGKAIQDAANAAVQERVDQDSNHGAPPVSSEKAAPNAAKAVPNQTWFGRISILSDTGGVDFGPYVREQYSRVRLKWYAAVMTVEYARYANGKLAIEFAVKKDGSVTGMKLVESSGDRILDRLAWTGIAASAPFAALPTDFKGDYLKLRIRFLYNPSRSELREGHRSALHPPM